MVREDQPCLAFLESNAPWGPDADGASFMVNCVEASGQLWRFVEATEVLGYYRLQSATFGDTHCLESNDPDNPIV